MIIAIADELQPECLISILVPFLYYTMVSKMISQYTSEIVKQKFNRSRFDLILSIVVLKNLTPKSNTPLNNDFSNPKIDYLSHFQWCQMMSLKLRVFLLSIKEA